MKINLWKREAGGTGETARRSFSPLKNRERKTAQRSDAEKGWRGKMRAPDEEKWGIVRADRLLIARIFC